MRIRTQLHFAVLLPIALVLSVAVFFWVTAHKVDHLRDHEQRLEEIRVANFELNILTQEYLLFGGKRVSKADVQVEAYGSLDELSSVLGMFALHLDSLETTFIEDVQRDIYIIMGALAGAPTDLKKLSNKIATFEHKIDSFSQALPPLKDFIIPGGSLPASWAHLARTTCRKAERVA